MNSDDQFQALAGKVDVLEADMLAMKTQHTDFRIKLDENTATTKGIKQDTESMIEMFRSWQGAFKTLEMIGKLFKPLGYIAIAVSAVVATWVSLKGGISPK